eukprot:gene11918-15020_t
MAQEQTIGRLRDSASLRDQILKPPEVISLNTVKALGRERGRFKVLGILAQGGFATVFRGRKTAEDGMVEELAVKVGTSPIIIPAGEWSSNGDNERVLLTNYEYCGHAAECAAYRRLLGVRHVPEVYDSGFTMASPHSEEEYKERGRNAWFVGTPDYASTNALLCCRQGPRDDLESLAYGMYELWHGQLDWDLTALDSHTRTLNKTEAEAARASPERVSPDNWTAEMLSTWANKRRKHWKELEASGRVPTFLAQWVRYCRGLAPMETIEYGYLRHLITSTAGRVHEASAAPQVEAPKSVGVGFKRLRSCSDAMQELAMAKAAHLVAAGTPTSQSEPDPAHRECYDGGRSVTHDDDLYFTARERQDGSCPATELTVLSDAHVNRRPSTCLSSLLASSSGEKSSLPPLGRRRVEPLGVSQSRLDSEYRSCYNGDISCSSADAEYVDDSNMLSFLGSG